MDISAVSDCVLLDNTLPTIALDETMTEEGAESGEDSMRSVPENEIFLNFSSKSQFIAFLHTAAFQTMTQRSTPRIR